MRSRPMENFSIPNFKPGIGRISTPWSRRSKRSNRQVPFQPSKFGFLFCIYPTGSAEKNAQRSTLNAQRSIQAVRVGRWMLGVGRWAFSHFRRVKGAWWPSRSSKPSLVGNGRDRFDSYPLRHSRSLMFDGRCLIEKCGPCNTSHFKPQPSNLERG